MQNKPTISSLLTKRDVDYDNMTNGIIEIIQDPLIKAVQYFLNRKRDLKILSIECREILPGFCFIKFLMYPNIGDIVETSKGQVVIDESTHGKLLQNVDLIVSAKVLDSNSAYTIYKNIKDVNHIISTSKENSVENLTKYNTLDIDDNCTTDILDVKILNNPEFSDILDILTKPKDLTILGFDASTLDENKLNLLRLFEAMDKNISTC